MNIIGNEKLIGTFFTALRENRVAGCYLIEGKEGTGKKSIARMFACALTSPCAKDGNKPCLQCPTCRRILSGGHVDVAELYPSEEGKKIAIDDLREMLKMTQVLPAEGDWRIFILPDSDLLRKDAQNALLKSIEEPRERTVFFLLTTDKSRLLPTVRSRAITLQTAPLTPTQMREALKPDGIPEEKLKELILLSGGSVGKAKSLLLDTDYHKDRERVLQYFTACFRGAGFTKLSLILPAGTMTRTELKELLPLIQSALSDLTVYHAGGKRDPVFFTDLEFLQNFAAVVNPQKAVELFEMTEDLRHAVDFNVNLFAALSAFHLTATKLCSAQ